MSVMAKYNGSCALCINSRVSLVKYNLIAKDTVLLLFLVMISIAQK